MSALSPSGFGSEAWGRGPWGGLTFAGSGFAFTAVAVRENVVRLTLSEPVQMSGLLDRFDGTQKTHYAFIEDDTTIGLDGSTARPVRAVRAAPGPELNQVDITLDRPLSPFPSRYEVLVQGLYNQAGLFLNGIAGAQFAGLYRAIVPPTAGLVVPSRDFANPQTLSALVGAFGDTTNKALLGTLQTDETGDIATDEGLISYKKRVFRRLSTDLGAFLHLPNYGVTIRRRVKQLGRPGLIQQLSAEAESQILQEPETQSVSVQIVQQGAITYYRIRIKTAAGQTVAMNAPVNPSGT